MHYVETYIFAPLLLYAVLVFVHYTFRSQAYTVSMVFYEAYGPVISLWKSSFQMDKIFTKDGIK